MKPQAMESTYKISTIDELNQIASDLISSYPNGTTVLLNGTLASGKTTLVNYIATKLDILATASPTFGIMHEYRDDFRHLDLYRVGSEGFFERGLHEMIGDGWTMIEWADEKIERYLTECGIRYTKIFITLDGETRTFEVSNG